MKRSSVFLLALALLTLGATRPARAENVVFQGKSECPVKCELSWPFSRDSSNVVHQDKGTGMAVSLQPEPLDSEKSAVALGSPLGTLHILSANAHIGQKVNGGEIILTYELPPDRVIAERDHLSRAKIERLEHDLAVVNFQLEKQNLQQEELEKAAAIKLAPPNTSRTSSMNFEALLKKRNALSSAYEEAKSQYDDDMLIAHDRFGKDLDLLKFPRKDIVGACISGYFLWVNSGCVPGAIFTKETKLYIIGQLDPILVRAPVHEIVASKLRIGDAATITFTSLPGRTYQSTISKIDYMAQPATSPEPSFYQVELSVANPDVQIKEGMRCNVSVTVPDGPRQ